jgi:hypothetical protein
MIEMFPDMIKGLPDMSVRFPDMIKKTPGTEKTPDTEKLTPDTTILDTLPDPKSKSSPPAGRGRMVASRPCPLCLALMLFFSEKEAKKI